MLLVRVGLLDGERRRPVSEANRESLRVVVGIAAIAIVFFIGCR